MKRDDKTDARIAELAAAALQGHCADPEAAARAVAEALIPTLGTRAVRRRIESQLMGAFREGYLSGKVAGRMAQWHSQVWRSSRFFKSLREPQGQTHERYDRYNY